MIAGVDGCRFGWVAALSDGATTTVEVFRKFEDVLATDSSVIVVDVPIGLTETDPRNTDVEARRVLGKRGCCVFPAPFRSMLSAGSYVEACAKREAIDGKRCSQQAFGIFPKILEVDRLMSVEREARVYEGHPEVTFAFMCGQPLEFKKKSRTGFEVRLREIETQFADAAKYVARGLVRGAGRDDVLDAYAMLWTASRVANGSAVAVASSATRDSRGLRMTIWA